MTNIFSRQHLVIFCAFCTMLMGGCSAVRSVVPADFEFIMDVRSPDVETAGYVNIRINAQGEGQFEYYNTGGAIRYDTNKIVTYEANQVVKAGEFNLTDDQLSRLWQVINENKFFELTADYRMAIGSSYAFILIEANGRRHIVDNIGMEVPEVRALVGATDTIVPEEINLEYGEGYVP